VNTLKQENARLSDDLQREATTGQLLKQQVERKSQEVNALENFIESSLKRSKPPPLCAGNHMQVRSRTSTAYKY
jgi:hypothetical protein